MVLTLTNIYLAPRLSIRPIKGGSAFVTVDAFGVMLAVLAYAAAFIPTVNVERLTLLIYFWIVLAFR